MTHEPPQPAPQKNAGAKTMPYALGASDRERRRLMLQGGMLRAPLEAAFRAAGIEPGMRVLDIGCGVGDVAMLAAELVGPSGSVVALDRDAASIEWARRRTAEAGFANIDFCAAEFDAFSDSAPFDALVGRFILLYLPDPAAVLRRLARSLRSGAVIAFMEPDFTMPFSVSPPLAELRHCETWIIEALRRSGARMDMGMSLHRAYRDAGFVNTATMVSHLSGCGMSRPIVDYFVETLRSMLPRIVEYGIATLEEVQIDTMADRMFSSARDADPQWVALRSISAWARKP
jgi:ubiquinone/menaquinone biosynthesis C-methylase UbiE